MTDVVIPSDNRLILGNAAAAATARGPVTRVVESGERAVELPEAGLDSGPFNGFTVNGVTDVGGDYEIAIRSGEAFISGAYVARDTSSSVTLEYDANGVVTVALGWEHQNPDGVVIQRPQDFADRDRYVRIWKITGSGNISRGSSIVDYRPLGVAIGDGAIAYRPNSLAVGDDAVAGEPGQLTEPAIAIGKNADAAKNSIAIGNGATNTGAGSVAIGNDTTANIRQGLLGATTADPDNPDYWEVEESLTVQGGVLARGPLSTEEHITLGELNGDPTAGIGTVYYDKNDSRFHGETGRGTFAFAELDNNALTIPTRTDDPPAEDGILWYRSDLDEYRGVEDGNIVSFDTTTV
jgi:hypothetical protein